MILDLLTAPDVAPTHFGKDLYDCRHAILLLH